MIRAYVNFALIKYWGKKDDELRLPNQASLSFTVDKLYTETSVEFNSNLKEDNVTINGVMNDPKMSKRVIKHLNYIRGLYNEPRFAYVNSINYVPTAAGLASSASSFAALTAAAIDDLEVKVTKDELSRISRIGSGSASRSIYGDFVVWNTGNDKESIGTKLDVKWPEFRIIVCLVSRDIKKHSSSKAMDLSVKNVEKYSKWVKESKEDLDNMLIALYNKDIDSVGLIAENNSNHMHDLIESTGIKYKNEDSYTLINRIEDMRKAGIKAYYTMDAGPNVKIITVADQVDLILNNIRDYETIVCEAGKDIHKV